MQDSFDIDRAIEEFIATLKPNVPIYVNLCRLYKHASDHNWEKKVIAKAQKKLQIVHDKVAHDKIKRIKR